MHEPLNTMYEDQFPDEFVSPRQKENPIYGLQYAQAMYRSSNRMGPRYYYDDSEYDPLIEIAQGRQSVENIQKQFGYYRDAAGSDVEQLAYLDVQVLNLAPKYINRAVAKMQRYSYDISADAVDVVSINEKEAYADALQAYYRCNNWLMEMGIDAKEMFPELDVDMLPKFIDELMYDATVNPKIKKEIWAETALRLLHYVNEFQQKMREVDWDIAVLGKGHLHFYNDENGVPRVEKINGKHYIGSYVENENFTKQEYAGFYDWITINQLRKEMLGDPHRQWTEQEIKDIADKWNYGTTFGPESSYANRQYDGLTYIPVLRFYFRSEDNRKFVKSKNPKYGFDQYMEKNFNYRPEDVDDSEVTKFLKQNPDAEPEEAREVIRQNKRKMFMSGERELIANDYCSIYGGTWIIDTDIVYNYGRKKLPRTNLVETRLPIVTFAPNMKDGRVVSFCAQMIEPLYMINVAHNKIKEILAKGWMGIREINLTALEQVSLSKGGNTWDPKQVMEFLVQTNQLVSRTPINKHDQKISSAITMHPSGVELADYFTTITTYIRILEEMTATPVADSMTIPDRLSATAAKESSKTSDFDMEYLFNAHEEIYKQGSHYLLLLLQESKRDKKKIAGFIPAMGKVNSGYFEVPDELAYSEYGITLRRKPTEEEWALFYQDVSIALEKEQISLADSVFVREIDNLKQARQILVIRHKMFQRQKMEEAKFMNDLAIQSNQAAAQAKLQGDVEKEIAKIEAQKELELLKGRIQMFLQEGEKRWDATLLGVENASKERIARDLAWSNIVKESQRSRAERYKSDNKLTETVINASQKAESDRKKLMAPKPKT